MTDASGTTSYEYSRERTSQERNEGNRQRDICDAVLYDMNGNLKTMTYPGGRVVTYNYTNDRAVSVLNNAANLATSITTNRLAICHQLHTVNGIVGAIGYDNQYRVAASPPGP